VNIASSPALAGCTKAGGAGPCSASRHVERLASANGRAILIGSLIVLAGRLASSHGAGPLRGWRVDKDAGFEEVSSRP
jgi:hypothetical protein